MTTTPRHAASSEAEPSVDRRVGDDAIRRPARPRAEPARLERERPLTDVDERSQQDRPDERDERPDPADERPLQRQTARLLCLEDRAGPGLHPRDHLDGGQDDERDPVAGASRDQRLERVVRERREQERDRWMRGTRRGSARPR